MSANKRILIVEQAPSLGGSLTSIELVIRHGQKQGFSFGVLCASSLHRYLPVGVDHHALSAQKGGYFGLWQLFRQVHKCIKAHHYDGLILNNLLSENFPALAAGLCAGIPRIQFARAYEREALSWRLFSRYVDAFVPVSESVGASLSALGAPPNKLRLAYEGIALQPHRSPADWHAMRMQLEIPSDARAIAFVGRLVPWKGFPLFVDTALAYMAHREDTYAVVIGEAPSGSADLTAQRKKIEGAGMSDRFRWCGEVAPGDVTPLLLGCDALLHTSIAPEPFGRVILEAMSLGVPVISCAEGGPREIITHCRDGLLTSSDDVKDLINALFWLFQTPRRAAEIGRRGRDTARVRFSEEQCVAPVLSFWRERSVG